MAAPDEDAPSRPRARLPSKSLDEAKRLQRERTRAMGARARVLLALELGRRARRYSTRPARSGS